MFERFSDRARQVLVLAQEQARRLNHGVIGTEHILLGLIQMGEGVGTDALTSFDISLETAQSRVDPKTGVIKSYTVPTPADNPDVRSPATQGFHGIESIAASPSSGDIAVAMEDAESVEVYDSDSGGFSTVRLPASDAPSSNTTDGTLAVSAVAWPSGREGVVDSVPSSGGPIERLTTDVGVIATDGADVLGTGTSQIVLIDPTGAGRPSTTSLYSTAAPPAKGAIDSEVTAVAGLSGVVVAGTNTGLVVLRAGEELKTFNLPAVACIMSGPGPMATSPTTSHAVRTCQTVATGIAIDSNGDIWLTESQDSWIFEIPQSSPPVISR